MLLFDEQYRHQNYEDKLHSSLEMHRLNSDTYRDVSLVIAGVAHDLSIDSYSYVNLSVEDAMTVGASHSLDIIEIDATAQGYMFIEKKMEGDGAGWSIEVKRHGKSLGYSRGYKDAFLLSDSGVLQLESGNMLSARM